MLWFNCRGDGRGFVLPFREIAVVDDSIVTNYVRLRVNANDAPASSINSFQHEINLLTWLTRV
jgi:hypothetical protein